MATKLEFLHLDKISQVEDISAVYALKNLRYLMLSNLPKVKQTNVDWLSRMPLLHCAMIGIETETINWQVIANHPRICDLTIGVPNTYVFDSDAEIIEQVSAASRKAISVSHFGGRGLKGIRIILEAPRGVAESMSLVDAQLYLDSGLPNSEFYDSR